MSLTNSCIICLDGGPNLLANVRCRCTYWYHDNCLKRAANPTKCPLCRAEVGPLYTAISISEPVAVQSQQSQQSRQPKTASRLHSPRRPPPVNTTPLLSSTPPIVPQQQQQQPQPQPRVRNMRVVHLFALAGCAIVVIMSIWFITTMTR